MRRRKALLTSTLALLLCLGLAACGAKQYPVQITVVNRTTFPIADLRIRPVQSEDWGENLLETTLAEGESIELELGSFTEAELDGGFNLQFYGEDGEPIDPEYDPDTVTMVESGNVFILAPPGLSVTLFVDDTYDEAVYDEKIAALYESDEVVSPPVLMGGALPFTHMQSLLAEEHDDGTYRYEDITEDGQLLVVNTAERTSFVPDVQELGDYLSACALSLSGAATYEQLSAEEDEDYTGRLSYPVYIVTYVTGEGEDCREWTVFALDTDSFTYLYGFCAPPDTAAEMAETYRSIFGQLYLSDEG